LYLCLTGDANFVVLNNIENLQLQKNILEQWIVQNSTWVEGSFPLQIGDSPTFLLIDVAIRNEFFDPDLEKSEEVLVDGQVWYSRTFASDDEEAVYAFQLNIPIKNTAKVVDRISNKQGDQTLSDQAAEEREKKRKFNLRLWTPIAVVLALLIGLTVKLVADFRNGH